MTVEPSPKSRRWTRDYIFDVLRYLKIEYIFGVPGTNEIPIIDGADDPANGVSYVQCLHENIAIGAAMGYARLSGKPGVLVVHVTPGIAHSIGNLFNAWRSRTPLVILCCQQQNQLVTQEPLLASNLVDLARQYTKWSHEVRAPEEIPLVLQRAFKEAMAPPTGPVFLAIPWDFLIREIGNDDRVAGVTRIAARFTGDSSAVADAVRVLAAAKTPVIVAGDGVGETNAWAELCELAELIGAPVVTQSFGSHANYPNDDYHWQGELPADQDLMRGLFAGHDVAFLCGFSNQAQVTVFNPAHGPLLPVELRKVFLANNTWDIGKNDFGEAAILGDIKATLPQINAALRAKPTRGVSERNAKLKQIDADRRAAWRVYLAKAASAPEIWAVTVADALRQTIEDLGLQKKFVYVHEAVSDPAPFQLLLPFGRETSTPNSYYCVGGGSLGWSMPATIGLKLSGTGWQGIETKLVVNAVGDGSALFYPQVWWSAAHRQLAVLYIITNNREYHTLQIGLGQLTASFGSAPGYNWHPHAQAPSYLRIESPDVDLLTMAASFGVKDGATVSRPGEVAAAVRRGVEFVLKEGRSYVLEVRTAQKSAPLPVVAAKGRNADLGGEALTGAELPTAGVGDPRYAAQPPLDFFHRDALEGVGKKTDRIVPLIN